jgi:hypothetical protein
MSINQVQNILDESFVIRDFLQGSEALHSGNIREYSRLVESAFNGYIDIIKNYKTKDSIPSRLKSISLFVLNSLEEITTNISIDDILDPLNFFINMVQISRISLEDHHDDETRRYLEDRLTELAQKAGWTPAQIQHFKETGETPTPDTKNESSS